MVELERLRAILSRLAGRIAALEPYSTLAVEDYLREPERVHASKYLLLTAIEDALAAANHVIASEGLRAPTDYADAFRSLVESGVVPPELGLRLEAMARFRNLLVHTYAVVDDRRVHAFLCEDVSDLGRFAGLLLELFAPQTPTGDLGGPLA